MVLKSFVVLVVLLCVSCTSSTTKNVEQETNQSVKQEDAESLFTLRCASCHGTDGKLGVAGAKDLSISELTDSEILTTIKNGKNGMPSFEGVLTREQQEALLLVVKSKRK